MSFVQVQLFRTVLYSLVALVLVAASIAFINPLVLGRHTKVTEHAISVGRMWDIATTAEYEYVAQTGEEVTIVSSMFPYFSRYVRVDRNRQCDCVTRVYVKHPDESWFSMHFRNDGSVSVRRGLQFLSPTHQSEMTTVEAVAEAAEYLVDANAARQYLIGIAQM